MYNNGWNSEVRWWGNIRFPVDSRLLRLSC